MKNEIENFCRYYNATVGQCHKQYRRPKVPKPSWDPMPGTSKFEDLYATLEYEDIPMIEIHMPEDRFRHFIEFREKWQSILEQSDRPGDMHYKLWQEFERESRLRAQHPGLQDLWEQYRTMLVLADSGQ